MYVCVCNALRESEFREAARQIPNATVEQVFEALDSRIECGSCQVYARLVLAEEQEKAKALESEVPPPV